MIYPHKIEVWEQINSPDATFQEQGIGVFPCLIRADSGARVQGNTPGAPTWESRWLIYFPSTGPGALGPLLRGRSQRLLFGTVLGEPSPIGGDYEVYFLGNSNVARGGLQLYEYNEYPNIIRVKCGLDSTAYGDSLFGEVL